MKKKLLVMMSIIIVLSVGLLFLGDFFFKKALLVGPKDFIDDDLAEVWKPAETWLKNIEKERWEIKSHDDLTLIASYIPSETVSTKTIVVAHGYGNNKDRMGHYIKMFHEAGYNVLAPDARGHGESDGNYIGFGWPERRDMIQWINFMQEVKNPTSVGLYGLSMGGATVMMTSGEEDLPSTVKVVVEDAGYTSIADELTYQLKDMYNLPSFPMIPLTSVMADLRLGFNFYEASAHEQIKKNVLPILFIHGDADKFVPISMVYELYQAQSGIKELYIVPDAGHADSYEVHQEIYEQRVLEFMTRYL